MPNARDSTLMERRSPGPHFVSLWCYLTTVLLNHKDTKARSDIGHAPVRWRVAVQGKRFLADGVHHRHRPSPLAPG